MIADNTTLSLSELEAHDRALAAVKATRTAVEYYWTATPAICAYALERDDEIAAITYLDADLEFFADPRELFAEAGESSVTIVPHRYAPEWQHLEAESGTFNVEFMTFRRDPRGLEALGWWRERCLEWCYARYEDGKMGDQMYLDDWPERFHGVHVLEHPGGGLAPWNASSHDLAVSNGGVTVDGRPLVFYHYHSLRLYRGITALRRAGLFRSCRYTKGRTPLVWSSYPLTPAELELLWDPYVRAVGDAIADVRALEPAYDDGFVALDPRTVAKNALRAASARVRREARGAGRPKAAATRSGRRSRR